MATPHLLADTAGVSTTADHSLASVAESSTADTHLVTLTQKTDWSSKEFIVPPTKGCWTACMATGISDIDSNGGANANTIGSEFDALISALKTKMDGLSWRDGFHPVVNCVIRRSKNFGPYSKRSGITESVYRFEYIHAMVAYYFNLHHLHLSKMTSFSAYMRVYVPSCLAIRNNNPDIYLCEIPSAVPFNNFSSINCRLEKSLPAIEPNLANGFDQWEICGNGAINDANVSGVQQFHSVAYNLFHGDDSPAIPVWTANQRSYSSSTAKPTMYYHDYQITNDENLALLNKNPAGFWAIMHYTLSNGASPGSGNSYLQAGYAMNAWFYRADLRLVCNSEKF